MKRNAAFLKKIDEAYRLMTPSERVEFDKLKASKYAANPRYNSYRDEVQDIELNSNVRFLVQDFNEIYEQTTCFAIIG